VEIVEGLVVTNQRAVEAAERLFQAAETRKTDLLQSRVELKKTQLDLVRTRARLAAAWRDLASVIGLPNLPRQAVRGETDPQGQPISWEQAALTVLAGNPQISRAMAEVNRATWTVQRARAQWIPNVTASVQVQHDNGTGDDFASVQVSLPIPIWNRNQGGVGDARAQLTAARRNVQVVELRLRQQLADEYQRYESAFAWARQYKDHILPLAQETLELVSRGYEQGEVAYLDFLTAQRTYVQSNLDYLEALSQLWLSIQRIEGLLLDESLDSP
jgi:cobalt-zinc-cadmium efflux system outer membrane protein